MPKFIQCALEKSLKWNEKRNKNSWRSLDPLNNDMFEDFGFVLTSFNGKKNYRLFKIFSLTIV